MKIAMGITVFAAAAATLVFAGAASAQAFMQQTGRTTQPVGHYEFCQKNPGECAATPGAKRPAELTRELWAEIVSINNAVNVAVAPRTDMEIWGVEERWSYPVKGVGDCEDYALEKRRMLNGIGVPMGNLLVTVVRQPNGDGHAVLEKGGAIAHEVLGQFQLLVGLGVHEHQRLALLVEEGEVLLLQPHLLHRLGGAEALVELGAVDEVLQLDLV